MGQVKWTPENDHRLLIKILELHELSLDYGAIAAAWPTSEDARPTARAIRERIFKIKQMMKDAANNASNNDDANDDVAPGATDVLSTSTPKKRRTPGSAKKTSKATPSTPKTPSRKRQRAKKSPNPEADVKSDPEDELDADIKTEPVAEDEPFFPADTQSVAGEAAALLDQFQDVSSTRAQSENVVQENGDAFLEV